jgi:DNA damage-binding protein 1
MCPFYFSQNPKSLVFINDSSLIIGTIDDIQKLHMEKVQMGETARRIVHQESTRSFGIATLSQLNNNDITNLQASSFKIMDEYYKSNHYNLVVGSMLSLTLDSCSYL